MGLLLTGCSLMKYKDLSTYTNLLLGTNNGTQNFRFSESGFNALLEAEGDGIIIKMPNHDDNGWMVLIYDDGHSRELLSGPAGETYTIAFEAKTNTKNSTIKMSHKQGNAKEIQVDFGTAVIEKTNRWTQVILSGTLNGTAATSQGVYFDLRENPAGTEISIRNLKLIRGTV